MTSADLAPYRRMAVCDMCHQPILENEAHWEEPKRATDPQDLRVISHSTHRRLSQREGRPSMIGCTTTVLVDGERITGRVYHEWDNGTWFSVETPEGRCAGGPEAPCIICGASLDQHWLGSCPEEGLA